MLSTQLMIMIVMLVFLIITCHWCQARKPIVKKMSLSRKSLSSSQGDDYESITMVQSVSCRDTDLPSISCTYHLAQSRGVGVSRTPGWSWLRLSKVKSYSAGLGNTQRRLRRGRVEKTGEKQRGTINTNQRVKYISDHHHHYYSSAQSKRGKYEIQNNKIISSYSQLCRFPDLHQ